MEEMKVREYGWWASYTYMKQNDETSWKRFKLGKERSVKVCMLGDVTNEQCEPIQNCHKNFSLHSDYILIKKQQKKKF
jgi:hypothetical protein